jgi:hypothetical protein
MAVYLLAPLNRRTAHGAWRGHAALSADLMVDSGRQGDDARPRHDGLARREPHGDVDRAGVVVQTDVGDQRVLVATVADLYFTQVLLVTGGDGETRADGGGV